MAKLRGSRLEAELDKCRGECNWARLADLLPLVRTKNSGVEKLTGLVEGELSLENFLDRQKQTNGYVKPKPHIGDFLRTTEGLLKTAIASNREKPTVIMECYLLLSKVHYFSASFQKALEDLEKSQLDMAKTQFVTLRSLKLAAEGYAIKGFATERLMNSTEKSHEVSRKRLMSYFESAVELTISYITEFEKSVGQNGRALALANSRSGSSQLGDLLEAAMERAPFLLLRRSVLERKSDEEGIELYRKIMTELSDKSVVAETQQRLCRQLAEILLRGSMESSLSMRNGSKAISEKSNLLNFYKGSTKNYYSPNSRIEEIILLLLISEMIASRAVKAVTYDGEGVQQYRLFHNLKQVHNLLSVVLSHIRQHSLLSALLDNAVQYAGSDRYIWRQFGLALSCTGRIPRAIKILEHATNLSSDDSSTENKVVELMQIAKMEIEQNGEADTVMKVAKEALSLCTTDSLAGRCKLLYALGYSLKVRTEPFFEKRRQMLKISIENFEQARNSDPADDLVHMFCALEYAEARNMQKAREVCEEAIDRNPYNVSAQMLLALLFTAKHDYKSAMRLVLKAMANFPSHYGLMVLRLKLESKFGRVDRAFKTTRNLLRFWQRVPEFVYEDESQNGAFATNGTADTGTLGRGGTQDSKSTAQLTKDGLAPVAPFLAAPLGISNLPVHSISASVNDISEAASNTIGTRMSEFGAATSTVSESLGMGTSSSLAWSATNTFRSKANIWVELAELLIDANRMSDIQICVEEACAQFPNSYQATYLKGRVFLNQAEKVADELKPTLHSEARASFLASVTVNPTHIPSIIQLANIYRIENNQKMAEKMLRDAVNIDPLREDVWQALGRVMAEQQSFDEANECFQTAASIDSTVPLMPFDVIPRLLKSTF
ncbi:unnamed protein product [Bursaphelenchus okinawaensis]|uniref:Tetratricopeptide repeat protein 7 N-terminal domain-containing protein n=1 Tax=Bursaphelenchus okinawaensis TaxID=465554 RepID=A0A811JQT8_9BILA|nr:unnamed protein product [Bursaphelenchus okinawaensis]CAG9078698.1 unnamed protein product [Bursaphelenchus okinawaensis]